MTRKDFVISRLTWTITEGPSVEGSIANEARLYRQWFSRTSDYVILSFQGLKEDTHFGLELLDSDELRTATLTSLHTTVLVM